MAGNYTEFKMSEAWGTAAAGAILTGGYYNAAVNVSQESVKPTVVKAGYGLPNVQWNSAAHQFYLDNLTPIVPVQQPRVVSQTIAAGTKVPPGTTVDLVLAHPATIPVSAFANPHTSLAAKTVADLTTGLLADKDLRETLLQYDSPADLPPKKRDDLATKFTTANITINEANTNTSFDAAFRTARAAAAFY